MTGRRQLDLDSITFRTSPDNQQLQIITSESKEQNSFEYLEVVNIRNYLSDWINTYRQDHRELMNAKTK